MIATTDVSAAVAAVLAEHLPPWLEAMGLPAPESYDEVPDREMVRRVQGTVVAVSVPGTVEPMTRRNDGIWDAVFACVVAVFHENSTAAPFPAATGRYAAAVRTVLKQHPSLGGFAEGVGGFTETVDPLGDAQSANVLGLALVEFAISVPGVSDESEMPTAVAPSLVLTPLVTVTV